MPRFAKTHMDDKSDMVDVVGDGEEVHVRESAEEECREEE